MAVEVGVWGIGRRGICRIGRGRSRGRGRLSCRSRGSVWGSGGGRLISKGSGRGRGRGEVDLVVKV